MRGSVIQPRLTQTENNVRRSTAERPRSAIEHRSVGLSARAPSELRRAKARAQTLRKVMRPTRVSLPLHGAGAADGSP